MTSTTIQARPTLYKGIQMRSRLEADYASALDRAGFTWEYEPVCFGSPDGQWLPDFKLSYPERNTYVEVKPLSLLTSGEHWQRISNVDAVLQKMTAAWLSEPDAWLQLVFWEYGCDKPDAAPMMLYGERGDPWLACVPNQELPLLWPGMGAYAAACVIERQRQDDDVG